LERSDRLPAVSSLAKAGHPILYSAEVIAFPAFAVSDRGELVKKCRFHSTGIRSGLQSAGTTMMKTADKQIESPSCVRVPHAIGSEDERRDDVDAAFRFG
jgi:hypothetical protein